MKAFDLFSIILLLIALVGWAVVKYIERVRLSKRSRRILNFKDKSHIEETQLYFTEYEEYVNYINHFTS